MMKRPISIFCLVLIYISINVSEVFGQNTNKVSENPYANLPFKERIFVGGNFGVSVGTVTSIYIAPAVGYKISPKFSAGLGPSYQYYKDSRYPEFATSIYGVSVFGRYFPLDMIYLQTEFQMLNLEEFYYNKNYELVKTRVNVPALLVGGGYTQRTPNGSGFFIGILYDLIGDVNSPYPNNVVFRIGGFVSL